MQPIVSALRPHWQLEKVPEPSYMSIFEAHHSITNLFKGCCCCCVNEPVPHLCHFDPDGPNSIERAKVAIEIDF